MRSLTEAQWQLYFDLAERLQRLPVAERRAALPALCGCGADRDVAALLKLRLRLKPDIERCRSGERIRNFELEECIGRGGMGAVYRARQVFSDGIEREVAVKLIDPELLVHQPHAAQRRFRAELNALVRLEHKGIARIYDGGIHRCAESGDETLYLAMELVRGRPLTEFVAVHRAQLGTAGIVQLLLRVCDAVAHAHRHGVVHRDLKPSNILVDEHGEPRVLDFGLAGSCTGMAPDAGHAGLSAGTPAYMSPEQSAGAPPSPAMDVYALGLVLQELLSGERPRRRAQHRGGARSKGSPSTGDTKLPRAACRPELMAIVATATAADAAARYASVAYFVRALSRALDAIDGAQHPMRAEHRDRTGNARASWAARICRCAASRATAPHRVRARRGIGERRRALRRRARTGRPPRSLAGPPSR